MSTAGYFYTERRRRHRRNWRPAIAVAVLALPNGDVLAAVQHVRGGQHGTTVYRVAGCPVGGRMVDTATGTAWGWSRGDKCIFSIIALAACGSPGESGEVT